MRRFLRPAWLISHVLVLALIVTMINLGLWQLRRLEERQARNDLLEQRSGTPLIGVEELAAELGIRPVDGQSEEAAKNGSDASAPAEYRVVWASGRYQESDEVAVRNRSLSGAPGVWILTPLELSDGSALVVNRGWVPQSTSDASSRPSASVPEGQVRVGGIVRLSEERRGLGVANPPEGVLTSLARADVGRYAAQLDTPVYPFYLQLESQEPPPPRDFPVMLERPPSDAGPHLSYAVQWFVFSAIAVSGYPLVLWRLWRRRLDPHAEETIAD